MTQDTLGKDHSGSMMQNELERSQRRREVEGSDPGLFRWKDSGGTFFADLVACCSQGVFLEGFAENPALGTKTCRCLMTLILWGS